MKNTQERINNRITEAEEWVSELEGRVLEITATKKNKKKKKRMKWNEDSLRDLWDIKCTSILITGDPEAEEREKGPKKISAEIKTENSPDMGK